MFATVPRFLDRAMSESDSAADAPIYASALPTAANRLFLTTCIACPTVTGIWANFLDTASFCSISARVTMSAVSLPCSASALSLPTSVPSASASISAMPRPFSMIELNSSPRSTPLPNAWVNWRIDAAEPVAFDPPTTSALLTLSTALRIFSCD